MSIINEVKSIRTTSINSMCIKFKKAYKIIFIYLISTSLVSLWYETLQLDHSFNYWINRDHLFLLEAETYERLNLTQSSCKIQKILWRIISQDQKCFEIIPLSLAELLPLFATFSISTKIASNLCLTCLFSLFGYP